MHHVRNERSKTLQDHTVVVNQNAKYLIEVQHCSGVGLLQLFKKILSVTIQDLAESGHTDFGLYYMGVGFTTKAQKLVGPTPEVTDNPWREALCCNLLRAATTSRS